MRLTVVKQIGKTRYPFTLGSETANLHDVLMDAEELSFSDIYKCDKCGNDNLILKAKEAGGFKYVEVWCMNKDCRATLTFGRKKENPNVFYARRNNDKSLKWDIYNKEETQTETKAPEDVQSKDVQYDDIPF